MANPSPLRYPGGKNVLYDYVRKLVLDNGESSYIEPYAGGAALAIKLLLNHEVEQIFINDLDKGIFNFWNDVVNHNEELIKKIINTDVNMHEWKRQKHIYQSEDSSPFDLGFATFFLNRTNRSGIISGGPIGGYDQDSKYLIDCRFNKPALIKKIVSIGEHRSRIKLYNMDAIDFINKSVVKTKNSMTFFDPPYFKKGSDLYRNFYSKADHIDLAKTIENRMIDKDWIVTYDLENFIKSLYGNFESIEYSIPYTAGKRRKGHEYMFFSNKVSSAGIEDYLDVY